MIKYVTVIALLVGLISGCSGVQTFPHVARAGDSVSLAMGWQKNFKRSNTTVTITPSIGAPIIYQPNNPAVRAIINFYPDPVSWLVVGTDTQQDFLFNSGNAYGLAINTNFTNGDHDWWQTAAFLDLPASLPIGETAIQLVSDSGESATSMLEIVSGAGSANEFLANNNGPLDTTQLASLERSPYFEVSFSGIEIPYAIELAFTYTGDLFVINPRSSIKNSIWSGNGSELKVMLLPAQPAALTNFHDFKFYIAGIGAQQFIQDIQPLIMQSMQAFNIDGAPVLGVNVQVSANITQ